MIKLKSVGKKFSYKQQCVDALQNIHLDIPEKTIFGIIGKSGAGKSTLLRCINLLEKPSEGEVWLRDQRLDTLPEAMLRKVRRKMGMIFQHFNLLESRNVFENVALPLEIQGSSRKGIQQKVTTLLQLVGLEEKSLSYPHQLSGGQKQRVAIARALVTDPEVLLCDEATSSLDPETTAAILSLLKKINRELGITIVIITHEMEVIKQICHQVAVLDKGKIIEQKTMIDLFTNPETGLAKRLTNAAFHVELPSAIRNSLLAAPAENLFPVVKLSFVGEQSRKPLMAELMKQYEVASNILLADIETIDDVIVGVTICQLTGQDQAIQLALKYLKEQVKVEVLGYAQ